LLNHLGAECQLTFTAGNYKFHDGFDFLTLIEKTHRIFLPSKFLFNLANGFEFVPNLSSRRRLQFSAV